MIFYNKRKPNSTIISKKTRVRIGRFVDGIFKTDNPVIIEKLKKHFKHSDNVGKSYIEPKEDVIKSNIAKEAKGNKIIFEKLKWQRLLLEANNAGINTYHMKKEDVIKALEEKKKEVKEDDIKNRNDS